MQSRQIARPDTVPAPSFVQSFSVPAARPRLLFESTLEHVTRRRSKGVVFLSGDATAHAEGLARAIAEGAPEAQWLVVTAPGVLTEKGEVEGEAGAVGMRLPSSASFVLCPESDGEFGRDLAARLADVPGSAACAFVASAFGEDEWLEELRGRVPAGMHHVFGGGSLPGRPLHLIEGGRVKSGKAAALVTAGSTVSRLCSSSACRLLSHVGRVTKAHGNTIYEIDGSLALERLAESTSNLQEQSLVLLARASDTRPLATSGRSLALTPIVGVDPSRGTLLASDPVPEGTPIAFAVRDAHGARTDFEAQLRTLRVQSAGTAPGFGLYVSCAGRGRSLYKSADVDVKLIAKHFPQMPLVGMHSTFEIAPLQGRLTPQVYAGVLGVFSLPS